MYGRGHGTIPDCLSRPQHKPRKHYLKLVDTPNPRQEAAPLEYESLRGSLEREEDSPCECQVRHLTRVGMRP
jgi:hypothetical protein